MRALVFSGGGARGAYECGAIRYLLGERCYDYAVYSGTSVGAMNGAFLAQHASGAEKAAAAALTLLWQKIDTKQVYRDWNFLGKLNALWKPSVYTTKPLRDLIAAHITDEKVRASGKKLRVSAVSLRNGERLIWTERSSSLAVAVAASAAMPLFFEPVEIDGALFVDGGVREPIPLKDAILAGATEIDVISLDEAYLEGTLPPSPKALDVGKRTIGTMLLEIEEGDLAQAELHNRLIAAGVGDAGKSTLKVRVLRPSEPLGDALDFSPAKVAREIDQGFADVKAAGW